MFLTEHNVYNVHKGHNIGTVIISGFYLPSCGLLCLELSISDIGNGFQYLQSMTMRDFLKLIHKKYSENERHF